MRLRLLLAVAVWPLVVIACGDRYAVMPAEPEAGPGDASAPPPAPGVDASEAGVDAGCPAPAPLTLGPGEFLIGGAGCTPLTTEAACGGVLGASYTYTAGCLPADLFKEKLDSLLDCDIPYERIVLQSKMQGTLQIAPTFAPTGTLEVHGLFDLPQACKAKLGSTATSCNVLGGLAGLIGMNGLECCDAEAGGCHCTLDSVRTLKQYQDYAVDAANGQITIDADKTYPYCVTGGGQLQIGSNAGAVSAENFVVEDLISWTLSPAP